MNICPVSGKSIYESPGQARAVARKSRVAQKLETYRCKDCNGWHLTSTPFRGRRKR